MSSERELFLNLSLEGIKIYLSAIFHLGLILITCMFDDCLGIHIGLVSY